MRVAIITGAGTGLGRATAHVLGAASVACVLVGRRADALQSTAADGEFPSGVLFVSADVASPDDRARIVAETLEHVGINLGPKTFPFRPGAFEKKTLVLWKHSG